MKIAKKIIVVLSLTLMLTSVFTGCAKSESPASPGEPPSDFNLDKDITVIARDSASGTRGAFHELMKIKVKEGNTEVDKLVVGALEFDGTDKVITAVEGDKYGIGYISLGSVSDRIKAVSVDSAEATIENVKSKAYKVARPFLLVTKGYNCEKLHSDILQSKREKIMKSFRNGDIQYLIATDVASRGLDISGVDHIYNYDIPENAESYIHRIGRTGRAGESGYTCLFVAEKDLKALSEIEANIGLKIERRDLNI